MLFNIRPFPSLSERCVTAVACSGPPCRSVVTMMHEAVLGKLRLWTGTKQKQDCEKLWKNDGEQESDCIQVKDFPFYVKTILCRTFTWNIYYLHM